MDRALTKTLSLRPKHSTLRRGRRWTGRAGLRYCLLSIAAIFVLSRLIYARLGVSFDAAPRLFYWQIIDPVLLRNAPWQSLFYLRNQLPALNLFIAVVVQLFPAHPAPAFQACYAGMGLILAISLFLLLDGLEVGRALSFIVSVTCAVSPVTVLYENWLFYEYPIAVLFCVAALFLHRYATSQSRKDGLVLFAALASIGLFRVIYHWVWYLAIAVLLLYALPSCRRKTAWCAAVPGVVLLAFYVKSLALFGLGTPGSDVYGAIAFTTMARGNLGRYDLARLAKKGIVSRVLVYDLDEVDKVSAIVPPPAPTGIPILDNRLKSTGVASMDSLWMAEVCKQIRRDGLSLLRYRPMGALTSIRDNIGRYFLPADIGWPFDGRTDTNARVLAPVLAPFDLAMTGTVPGHQYAWLSFVTVPMLLSFGLVQSGRWLRRAMPGRASDPKDLTIVFAFVNIAWLTAVIVFYDFTDQNRIIFEIFPLFAVLLGCSLSSVKSLRGAAWAFRPRAARNMIAHPGEAEECEDHRNSHSPPVDRCSELNDRGAGQGAEQATQTAESGRAGHS